VLSLVLTLVLMAPPACHVPRDADGRIKRDPHQTAAFRATHPCPPTGKTNGRCYGYTIDHVCPLACCGRDDPSNMQWQTNAEAKAKDAWEQNCSTCPWSATRSAPAPQTPPTPELTPALVSVPESAPPPALKPSGCCKRCAKGRPCGDSCIPADEVCHKSPGCACVGIGAESSVTASDGRQR
jgi:hypothetical protein